ncbi:MAG: hypothetical protein HKM06_02580 [Spirochaetales bacterium]|nr:hypothetical protein [Spirochaetales bacterium]
MSEKVCWYSNAEQNNDKSQIILLSRQLVQTFIFELPALKPNEVEPSLRYKVQSELPLSLDSYVLNSRLFRSSNKNYGAVFLVPKAKYEGLAPFSRQLRVGVPPVLPKGFQAQVLLFVSAPEGLECFVYENGVLKVSTSPVSVNDLTMPARIRDLYPEAQVVAWAPDSAFPLGSELSEFQPVPQVQVRLLKTLVRWEKPQPRYLLNIAASFLLIAGLVLLSLSAWNVLALREKRNSEWKTWVSQASKLSMAPTSQEVLLKMLKLQGVPVPGLFLHLSKVWKNDGTKILELSWSQNKLTITAESPSALTSLRHLTEDPWFKDLKIDDIRTPLGSSEIFTVEGDLSIDS